MTKSRSQRGEKPVRKMHPNSLANLQPFKTGDDPRRNVGGVPQDTKELNALLDEIFAEEISDDRGNKMGKLRAALNRMLLGKNIVGAIHLLDRRYGKLTDRLDLMSGGKEIQATPEQIAQRVAQLLEIAKQRKEKNGN